MKLLIFDTETTGLPKSREPAIKGSNNWPHLVSIGWTVLDTTENYNTITSGFRIIKPDWEIPEDSIKIHGITQAKADSEGIPLSSVISEFLSIEHDVMIAHNMDFDYNVLVNAIVWDLKLGSLPDLKRRFCTMKSMQDVMKIPYANGRGFKPPKLSELYEYVTTKKANVASLHSAQYDTELLAGIVKNSSYLQSLIGLDGRDLYNVNGGKKARTTLIL
jgi:DNA polymerase III epsilon subunit-like protein